MASQAAPCTQAAVTAQERGGRISAVREHDEKGSGRGWAGMGFGWGQNQGQTGGNGIRGREKGPGSYGVLGW